MENFKELTQALIQTQVLAALKDAPEYLDDLVRSAMETEVNEYGGKPDYNTKSKMPWLEWCVRDALETATRKAVIETVSELEPSIKKSVKKALTADDIVSSFVKEILANTADYKINVEVAPEKT